MSALTVEITSFSYKDPPPVHLFSWDEGRHGGGFVFDLRSLPNPGRQDRFKTQTGRDPEVIDFLEKDPDVSAFRSHVFALVESAVRNYLDRGFTYLIVGFGCTGGQHRSVYFTEQLWQDASRPPSAVRLGTEPSRPPQNRRGTRMKAMVFAAGVGSRLKELTKDCPKCLIRVGGRTMLEIVIERLKEVGVVDIMINVHHLADMVIEHVAAKESFGVNISFSREVELLDTGGGLKRAKSFFEHEPSFFVHNSDVYSEIDLKAVLNFHLEENAIATLPVMVRESSRGLYFDESHRLVGWTSEKVTPPVNSHLKAFSGIQVVSSKIFDFMDERDAFSIIAPYLAAARSGEKVLEYDISDDFWMDMGSPSDLNELRRRVG